MNDDNQQVSQQQVTPAFSSDLTSTTPTLYSDAGDDYQAQNLATQDASTQVANDSTLNNNTQDPQQQTVAQNTIESDQNFQETQNPQNLNGVSGVTNYDTQLQQQNITVPSENLQSGANQVNDVISAAALIAESKNILITVSRNPSIDELSAAIGLTLALDKMDKKATAIYSGRTPHAISFLDPDNTFQDDVSSLRDFIISLDKAKADRLRYKVDNDSGMVKIFVTPYRTKITSEDLNFSEGDYNVDTVVALGVKNREDFDEAILSHGRILHDAKMVTINSGDGVSALGSVNWDEPSSSSISEMVVSLIDNVAAGIMDSQIATSLMTGIVAATDRFSNLKTTPEVMQIASRLMSSGANQQLISSNVANTTTSEYSSDSNVNDDELVLEHGIGENQNIKDRKHNKKKEVKNKNEETIKTNNNVNTVVDVEKEFPQSVDSLDQVSPQNPTDPILMAREEVNDAEEISAFTKEAVGLQGSLDVKEDDIKMGDFNNSLKSDEIDTSVQMKQAEQVAPLISQVPVEVQPEESVISNEIPMLDMPISNDLSLPPLPPIPPSLEDITIPQIQPDFMANQTSSISSISQSAEDIIADRNAKIKEDDARQDHFDSLYGKDPNKIGT